METADLTHHISRRFNEDLEKVRNQVLQMGGFVEQQLHKAITALKPKATLVYCTCSLEPEEGEQVIAELLNTEPTLARMPIEIAEVAGLGEILTPQGDLRTLPCHLPNAEDPRLGGLDGFYAARLVRRE